MRITCFLINILFFPKLMRIVSNIHEWWTYISFKESKLWMGQSLVSEYCYLNEWGEEKCPQKPKASFTREVESRNVFVPFEAIFGMCLKGEWGKVSAVVMLWKRSCLKFCMGLFGNMWYILWSCRNKRCNFE